MKSIRRNFLYQALYEVLIILMPLATSPYISRILGAEAIGVYSYTYSVANYFVLFAMLGISNYGNRLISSTQNDRAQLNREFSSLFWVHIIFSALVLGCYFIYCFFWAPANERVYSLIQGMFVASAIFDINWFFFGIEEFKLSVTRNTIIKILSFASIFLFVRQKGDLDKYCCIMAGSILFSQIAVWPFLRRYVSFVRVTLKDMGKHVRPMIVLFVPVLAVSLYKIMDKVMLGAMDTRLSLGYYENAEKVVSVFVTAVSAFGTVMLPRMNNLFASGEEEIGNAYLQRSMKWIPIVTYAVAFGVIGVSSNFVRIFWGEDFSDSAPILSVLICSLPFVAFASVIRMQYLIPKHKDWEYIVSVCGGAVINLTINYLLIPKYAGVGAAIGTICAEGFVCLYQAWTVRNETEALKYIRKSIPFMVAGAAMGIIVRHIGNDLQLGLLPELLIQIAAGCLIYFALLSILLHKEIATHIRKRHARNRLHGD